MYWSEWGQSGSIKKAAMDGTNRTTLVLNSGHALLAIDAESRRLYWTDVTGNVSSIVVMSDLNGLNKRAIFNETNVRISALTVYREFLFLSDENGGTHNNKDVKTFFLSLCLCFEHLKIRF